jgi:hypothetical protein
MMTPRRVYLIAVALAAWPLVQACTTREVVGVDIGTVTMHPPSASLIDGQSLQFSATVTDASGALLLGATVIWTTDDPDIVSIDSAGMVQALGAGTATIRGSFQGVDGTATVAVLPAAEIVLTVDSVVFVGGARAQPPAPVVIQVLSTGAGTIGALEASVEFTPGQPGGWLSTTLGATTAPTSLALTPETSTLPGGAYEATVVLDSDAGHGPVFIRVSLYLTSVRLRVTESGGSTTVTESGETDNLAVVLETAPDSDVVVELVSGDATEVTPSPTRLTFTPATWNVPRTVTVSAPDDQILDGNVTTPLTLRVVDALTPSSFAADPDTTIQVLTVDDERAGFTVVESGGRTIVPEGGTAEFTVVLDAGPLSDVVIRVTSADPSRVSVEPSLLTFTPENWATPQVVVVSGARDGKFDLFKRIDVIVGVDEALSNEGFDSVPDQVVSVRTIG